ncbi:MAG TPA: response regulator [Tepidisphaeraceae bacterium]|nr:response regulator [Tepidisphaeraceae bacterium]
MTDSKVNILLVDDRPDKLLALEAVLEDLGQNLVRAGSGRQALRALLAGEFAVILLDVNMPGMDGLETASLIRQRRATRDTPIIFVTSFADELHVARGYSLGAVDYILAPVVPEVLRTKVAVFVDLYRKTREVRWQAELQQRRAAQLQKLASGALAINAARSLAAMLQTVADIARDIIGAHQAITLFIPHQGIALHAPPTQACGSFSEKYADWRGRKLRLDPCASTQAARGRRAVRMTNEQLHRHPDWQIVRDADVPPIHGMIAAPLTATDDRAMGVIYLSDRYDGEFTVDDEAILTQLAQMTSIAIENTLYAQEREANRVKDEFLATLSHELRTPLNAILGWAQLLRMESLDEQVGHGLEVIERNARSQTKLIEDLLDVSRITTGKLRLSVQPVSLCDVLAAAIDAARPAADAKSIALSVDLANGSELVSGDSDRLQQVAWNLLSNAVKFTPSGGRVSLTLGRHGAQARMTFTDSGRGIAPEFLPYVFDRFRQADSTSTRQHGGLGIGLTIVRHIVELHGGAVWAHSEGEGLGASFVVDLPLLSNTAQPIAPAPAPAKSGPAEPCDDTDADGEPISADLNGLNILIVDDEPDAREVIAAVLSRAGASVSCAGSVREALDKIEQGPPDVLVSDVAMPDRDGYDLIRLLRETPAAQGGTIPALALTAYAREEDRFRALTAGYQAHLAKPVSPADLTCAIARIAASRLARLAEV